MLFSISILLGGFVGILIGQYFIIGDAAAAREESSRSCRVSDLL